MTPRLTDLHPHEAWIASGAALDAAVEWAQALADITGTVLVDNEAALLNKYLGTAQSDDDYDEWCRQERHEHHTEMRDDARQRGDLL